MADKNPYWPFFITDEDMKKLNEYMAGRYANAPRFPLPSEGFAGMPEGWNMMKYIPDYEFADHLYRKAEREHYAKQAESKRYNRKSESSTKSSETGIRKSVPALLQYCDGQDKVSEKFDCNRKPQLSKQKRSVGSKKVSEWVVPGEIENYDVTKVLEDLGENPIKTEKVKKMKVNPFKHKLPEAKDAEGFHCKGVDEIVGGLNEFRFEPKSKNPSDDFGSEMEVKMINEECSLCFCKINQTFLLIPCGHATFCKKCARHILNDVKKCPKCQISVKEIVRVLK